MLKLQPSLPRGIGKRADGTVIAVASPIKNNRRNLVCEGHFRDLFTQYHCCGGILSRQSLCYNRFPCIIIDKLHRKRTPRTVHSKTRALRRTPNHRTDAAVS